MRELIVKELEAGQRLDKFLRKYLKEAPNSFLYKMMRKKNIVLNGKKVTGNEQIKEGDSIKLFLSEDTIDKFMGQSTMNDFTDLYRKAYAELKGIQVVSEFEDVLFINKPAGILSQQAEANDLSANEWLIGYLLSKRAIFEEDLKTFKPSVCNRLDRNTSGLLVCSKTLLGSQEMARILKDRSLHKFYRCLVHGKCELNGVYEAFLYKDEKLNKVTVYLDAKDCKGAFRDKLKPIKTGMKPVEYYNDINCTELEIELFTGKTHQIRAQMEKLGFPLVGDVKYAGDKNIGKTDGQLLHAYRLVFPKMNGKLSYLSEREIICKSRILGQNSIKSSV
ncbi:MAG: RluA family pseudouridine synthase [Lachnospiraceae bacterium]|nr:RluA family pseudouridine synthase [Lachnospiraceae bacterium]